MSTRPAAVAGTWYPGSAGALRRDVQEYLDAVPDAPLENVTALIAPHAGLMFSGPVGAHAYKAASRGDYDVAVLVGPSHYVAFDGVALYPEGAFETPLGPAVIDREAAQAIAAASPLVQPLPSAHRREHSLEMQLPFLKHVLPDVPIVPLLMGYQERATITALGEALASALRDRRALIVGSTDLSHFFDAATASSLDARVQQVVAAFDPDSFLDLFEQYPSDERGRYVACGGGPAISVLLAARALGASAARVLRYGHSGEISGDFGGVVGYMAAAVGTFN
jgi:AmmeMemoRadiSam system protein B